MQIGSLVQVKKDTPYIWNAPLNIDDATSLGRFGRQSVGIILEFSISTSNSKTEKISREVKVHVDGIIGWVSMDYLVGVK